MRKWAGEIKIYILAIFLDIGYNAGSFNDSCKHNYCKLLELNNACSVISSGNPPNLLNLYG